jgi:hypothetical protein
MSKKNQEKNRPFVSISTFIILSLLVGIVIGFGMGSSSQSEEISSTHDEHKLEDSNHDHSSHIHDIHSHETLEITSEEVPTLEIEVIKDEKSGYNLEIKTENFNFISTANYNRDIFASSSSASTFGHAHLYINGEKITRIYSNSYYLGELEGHNEISITLNSNNHEDYTIDGKVIKASQILVVK